MAFQDLSSFAAKGTAHNDKLWITVEEKCATPAGDSKKQVQPAEWAAQ